MRELKVIVYLLWIVAFLLTACASDSWKLVAGSTDLLKDVSWACSGGNTTANGAVAIAAGNEFRAYVNIYGPRLITQGDFSVAVTLSAAQEK